MMVVPCLIMCLIVCHALRFKFNEVYCILGTYDGCAMPYYYGSPKDDE